MKVLLALLGAIVGAATAIFFVANRVSTAVMSTQSYDSPDQAAGIHSLVYLVVLGGMLVVGYLIGLGLGHLIERARGGQPEI